MRRESKPAHEAVLVDVEKICRWGQGDHNHLALVLAPVAARFMKIKIVELMA